MINKNNSDFKKNNLIVIIPTYNEEKNIINILKDLNKLNLPCIIVDDCSIDNTRNIIDKYKKNNKNQIIYTIYKNENKGKSEALKDGTNYALKLNYEYICFIDGDYQHKPEDIPKLYKKLIEKNGDCIFGVRKYKNIPFYRIISNSVVSVLMSIFVSIYTFKLHIFKDVQCGFKIIKKDLLKNIYFGDRYSVEHLLALQLAQKKAKIIEDYISIEYHDDAVSYITTKLIINVPIDILKYIFKKKNK